MHSFGYRANAVATFAITILAVMCCFVSLCDNFNVLTPSAEIKVMNINWFQKKPNGDDEVSMTLNISADLSSLFAWNTKQGNNLRGKEFNLTLHWHVMPKTGKMSADKIVMSGYRLPVEYR